MVGLSEKYDLMDSSDRHTLMTLHKLISRGDITIGRKFRVQNLNKHTVRLDIGYMYTGFMAPYVGEDCFYFSKFPYTLVQIANCLFEFVSLLEKAKDKNATQPEPAS